MADAVEDLSEVGRRLIGMLEGVDGEKDKQLAWCVGRVAEGADEIERLRAELADIRANYYLNPKPVYQSASLPQLEPDDAA